jgi:CcmD family protein
MEETKIFVVITVLSTVLIGLAIYLFWLDRRVTKMEKEIKNNKD